jgi:ppGpp synthetase/RelA/SpoT-type nucleotidyltranferase
MTVTDDFLDRYTREFDFFQEAARLCSQRCDTVLRQNGIRAIVGYRAKTKDRLEEKLSKRKQDRNYTTVDDIYGDLVDLAGVRIALYFPGDIEIVGQLIHANLRVDNSKVFPRDSGEPAYVKRFSGYWARHYRVRLPPAELPEESRRYAEASVEVQVASVLIHAWAEVEHDLVYKPLSGKLSDEEYAILDELNGLVLAGEIALQRLQKAGDLRLDRGEAKFNNHYELAKYIYERIIDKN